jgi:hypothetical protein
MRKEAHALLGKSLDSLMLAIEIFNRPSEQGRTEAVLIFLDRAFELFLKSALRHKNRSIREKGANETYGFDKCVRICVSDAKVKCLSTEEALTLQIVNSLRDAAQHYLIEVSEPQLYLYAQAGLSLYRTLLQRVFSQHLSSHFPDRVLPVSSSPPTDLAAVIESEFEEIKKLVKPGSRKGLESYSRLRSLSIIESSLSGTKTQPNDDSLKGIAGKIRDGASWTDIFPGVASLRMDTEGSGLTFSIRLTKKEGVPVRLVPEGTPGATVISVKRVNELEFYSLNLSQLAHHLELSAPRCLALVHFHEVQQNVEFFKTFAIGRVSHKRYSRLALESLRAAKAHDDMDAVWAKCKPIGKSRRR